MSIKTKVLAAAAALTVAGGFSTAATLPAAASTTQCGGACVQIFSKMFGRFGQLERRHLARAGGRIHR